MKKNLRSALIGGVIVCLIIVIMSFATKKSVTFDHTVLYYEQIKIAKQERFYIFNYKTVDSKSETDVILDVIKSGVQRPWEAHPTGARTIGILVLHGQKEHEFIVFPQDYLVYSIDSQAQQYDIAEGSFSKLLEIVERYD